jgi:hypothetical protein
VGKVIEILSEIFGDRVSTGSFGWELVGRVEGVLGKGCKRESGN